MAKCATSFTRSYGHVTANKSEKLFTDFIGAREKADISSDVRYTDGEWHLVNDDGSNSYKKPL